MPEYDIYLNDNGTPVKPKIDSRVSYLEAQVEAVVEAVSASVKVVEERVSTIEKPVASGSIVSRTLQDRFSDVTNVKDYGAKGDGVTDDTAAIQAALNRGGSIFFPSGSYCVSRVNVPTSVHMINGNGATILRNKTATSCIVFDDAENLTIKDLVVSCKDDTIHGEAFRGQRLKNVTFTNLRCIATAPYDSKAGDWAFMLSGSCIRMDGIYIESTAVGAWGDGIHLGWVEDFSLTNFDIHAGDDAIALFQMPPMTGDWIDAPSRNIVIGNGLLQSSNYSCVKLGCNPYSASMQGNYPPSVKNHCVQDALFHDIIFHDSTSLINTEDKRSDSDRAKFTNIVFDNCHFDDFGGGRAFGNPAAGVNFGAVHFSNCKFRRDKSSGYYTDVRNIDSLVFDNCVFSDTSNVKTNDFVVTEIGNLAVKNCYFSQVGNLAENGQLLWAVRVPNICITACVMDAQDAYAAVALDSLPENGKVIFTGNVIRGTIRSVRVVSPPANLSELLMVGNVLTGGNGLSTVPATVKIVS